MNKNKKLLLTVGGLILVILGALIFYQSQVFHLVKTDPENGSQPNQYTAVSFFFNQRITQSGSGLNQISIMPALSGKVTVGPKDVTFVPNASFATDANYTAVLSGVKSLKGKSLTNMKISFRAQYVDFSSLPKNVQQRLVSQTDTNDRTKAPYSPAVISIQGSDSLISYGLTSQQLGSLKIAFFNFFRSMGVEVRGMSLSNIVKAPHDPDSSSTVATISFRDTLDDKVVYSGRLDFSNLTTVRLYLYNSKTNSLLYDSGAING